MRTRTSIDMVSKVPLNVFLFIGKAVVLYRLFYIYADCITREML